MTNHASTRLPRGRKLHRRVPAFIPVSLRGRRDGWTPERQANFLGALAVSGLVGEAARHVGMSRESAYRLRRRPGAESFAAAWDSALGAPWQRMRKVTSEELVQLATEGRLKPVLYRGRHIATVQKPDNSALLRLVARLNRTAPSEFWWRDSSASFAAPSASTRSADISCGAAPCSGRNRGGN